MTYSLGSKSRNNLKGVHPNLVRVVERAIQLTPQDFTVQEGLRTRETQRLYVQRGVSKTMNSMHLLQPDGFGHAVDLVPWINGQPRWEWPLIYPIADAVRKAAVELGVRIRWGGCWQDIASLAQGPDGMKAAVNLYVDQRRRMGRTAFLDGPHYELGG
jgi:peptidoglycan L-alanyl-D-glutamate endopeptidase CwlK